MNRGSANGDAFVDWRTKCTNVLNHDIYVPSRRSRAVPHDPTTLLVEIARFLEEIHISGLKTSLLFVLFLLYILLRSIIRFLANKA